MTDFDPLQSPSAQYSAPRLSNQAVQTSTTAMHPALDKQDIVLEIFSHLPPKNLVAFAQTSHAYFRAWIPLGWKAVRAQAVYCLLSMVDNVKDETCPCRTPEISKRFMRYSHTIQTVIVDDRPKPHDKASDKNSPYHKGYMLLRNTENLASLKKFFCSVHSLTLWSSDIPPLAFLCVTPNLKSLQIGTPGSEIALRHFLSAILSIGASIDHFAIDDLDVLESDTFKTLVLPLLKHSKVVRIYKPQHGLDIMRQAHATIVDMAIYVYSGRRNEASNPVGLCIPEHLAMPRLQILHLGICNANTIRILSCLDAPLLVDVQLLLPRLGEDPHGLTQVLEALPYSTLRNFSLYTIAWNAVQEPLGLSVFQPLLQHNLLARFSLDIRAHNELSLSDADVDQMARAWPQLEALVLSFIGRPTLTLKCMESLREHCPKLRFVQFLDVGLTFPPPPPKNDGYASQAPLTLSMSYRRMRALRLPSGFMQYLRSLWANIEFTTVGW